MKPYRELGHCSLSFYLITKTSDHMCTMSTKQATLIAHFCLFGLIEYFHPNNIIYYNADALYLTVPVNKLPEKDGSQRFYQEKISYEHQYNSRFPKNYPIRSTVSEVDGFSRGQLEIGFANLIYSKYTSQPSPQYFENPLTNH